MNLIKKNKISFLVIVFSICSSSLLANETYFTNDTIIDVKFKNIIEIGAGLGKGNFMIYPNGVSTQINNDKLSFCLHTVFGLYSHTNIYLGLGFGLDYWSEAYFIPVFINPRLVITNERIQPFVSTKFGYSYAKFTTESSFASKDRGGLIFEISAGINKPFKTFSGLNFALGYKLQQSKAEYIRIVDPLHTSKPTPYYIYYSFLTLMIGISF
jgi:hypothetical protein